MFLKTLQIKGFKSFADAATLDLEPGVTVVVGPNGSGKSNVVDAIGWVLGAQAPSAVRSQKMDDVIFAGSQKRPALGRAEVTLTIDNSAGLLPIEFAEVAISRTLFRSGDSECALNGTPCRLLDITELLSDSGVGRQQHVIISQGQIDAVLNAKPEDRRLIIEEAAGVLKFRRRKEKAERRLAATDANQIRVVDLLKEVRRQLRPLERQADAARRHGDVVAELQALRVHLAGREVARLSSQLADGRRRHNELRAEERTIKSTLAALDAEIIGVEAELSASGDDRSGEEQMRLEALRERARGLTAVVAERRRSIERERGAFVDQAVVASLAADLATARRDLDSAEAARAGLAPAEESLAAADAALAAEPVTDDAVDTAAGADAAAAARGELAALCDASKRSGADLQVATDRLDALTRHLASAQEALDRLRAEQAADVERHEAARRSATRAEAVALDAEAAAAEADATSTAAAAEHHAWAARVEALNQALDAARSRAGADLLGDLPGVLGTLLDVIEISPGFDGVVEQALSGVLDAVVVESPSAGRAALEALERGDLTGAVLAVGSRHAAPAVPTKGRPIRSLVRGLRPGIDELLDSLIGGVALVDDWHTGIGASIAEPASTFVTAAGERFSSTGWRRGGTGSLVTAATLAEASERAAAAEQEWLAATGVAESTRTAAQAARNALSAAQSEFAAATARNAAAASALATASTTVERAANDLEGARETVDELGRRSEREATRRAELESVLPDLEAAAEQAANAAQLAAARRRELSERTAAVARQARELAEQVATIEQQRRSLRERVAQLEQRLERHQAERVVAESRQLELDARLAVVVSLRDLVDDRSRRLDDALTVVRAARQRQTDATRDVVQRLEALRGRRSESEGSLEVTREHLQRQEIADAETSLRLESVTEAIRHDLDVEPDAAVASPCPEVVGGATPQARVRELERDLRLMGPINPLALEEFQALNERHEFLEGQLEDIRQTRRELNKIISAVDDEIVSVFAGAFADVATNFEALFETLFPGGQGALRLTEPGDLLNTGIELEARPSGKNVKKLSLLSGGERSLTALAYLFAVFRSRPSPFYVMDEVEAALDDVNLHRFLGLVQEFRSSAQLIIVSHQKRTMEAADVLYGITMEPGGSSKVLSERVATVLD